jgi:hypothetical protein
MLMRSSQFLAALRDDFMPALSESASFGGGFAGIRMIVSSRQHYKNTLMAGAGSACRIVLVTPKTHAPKPAGLLQSHTKRLLLTTVVFRQNGKNLCRTRILLIAFK